MNLNAFHHTVEVGSLNWYFLFLGLALALFTTLFLGKKLPFASRIFLARSIAIVMLLNFIFHHIEALYHGTWRWDIHLPLQMCGMSALLAIFVLWTRMQWVYEWLLCWSAGAVHSFLTPELTYGAETYHYWNYAIEHAGAIIAPLLLTIGFGMRPRDLSWWRVFLWTQLTLPVIGVINYVLNANYMYIAQRPEANNPVIIGDWPWYIIGLEFVALAHFWLFYKLHRWLAKGQTPKSTGISAAF
jgi:hypothetical integral membrane protein (TIGR02206 family)